MQTIHQSAQKRDDAQAYDKKFRQFILGILYFITVSYIILPFMYYPLQYPSYYLSLIAGIIHIIAIIVVHAIPTESILKLVKPYLIVLILLLFPTTVFNLLLGIVTQLFWISAAPICIYVIHPNKKTMRWALGFQGIMLLAFVLSLVLQHYETPFFFHDLSGESFAHVLTRNIINAFFAFLLTCYSLYYLHHFHQMQIHRLMNLIEANDKKKANLLIMENEEKEEKYRKIYTQIVEYLETKQLYLRADFTLAQMANDLNINVTYLSKAINNQKNMNFNSLINSYRINKVKELIQQASSRKYTLKYIYHYSGFNSQSSFNKTFLMQEGITPSEYYKQQIKKGN
ncbi:hypothetical protein AGMMS50239_35570 [Bacteroidia bacterium]|nr:hypothetical protein AGMMS50239_35570 [Bacteroidia bacterium]